MENKEKSASSKGFSRRGFIKASALVGASLLTDPMQLRFGARVAEAQQNEAAIKVILSADADTYDPHSSTSDDGRMIAFHIYESLVDYDLKPSLAESWENPDKLTWLFHLKKGVKFTNGDDFDANAVKFSIERYLDPKTKARYRGLLAPVEAFAPLDKHTFQVKTKFPFANLLNVIRPISIMSPKAVADMGDKIMQHPIGTGPFVFKEWVPMEKTVIEANPDYHGRRAKMITITWRPVPEPATRLVELQSKQADLISKVAPELVQNIKDKDLEVIRVPSIFRMGIMFNCAVPPFSNVKIRQALNYAVNKEHLIEYILRGAGYIMNDPAAGFAGPNPDIKPYPHNIEKAKQLLAEAGFKSGVDCEIITPNGRYLKDKEMVEAVAFQAKESGFNIKVTPLEWGMFLKSYKTAQAFFIGSYQTSAQMIFYTDGDSRAKSWAWMGWHNDEFIRLMDRAEETFDVEERNAIYRKMAKLEWEDAVYLWMYFPQDIYAINKRLKNFVPRSDGYIVLHDAHVA